MTMMMMIRAISSGKLTVKHPVVTGQRGAGVGESLSNDEKRKEVETERLKMEKYATLSLGKLCVAERVNTYKRWMHSKMLSRCCVCRSVPMEPAQTTAHKQTYEYLDKHRVQVPPLQ